MAFENCDFLKIFGFFKLKCICAKNIAKHYLLPEAENLLSSKKIQMSFESAHARRAPPSAGVVMVGEDVGDRGGGRGRRTSKSGGGGGGDDGCCDRAQSLLDRVPPCTCESATAAAAATQTTTTAATTATTTAATTTTTTAK